MKGSSSKSKRSGGGKSSRNKRKTISKQMSRVIDDENTTNSEASEHGVFSDINWEENLEVDTTSLLDEFAPQAISRSAKVSLPSSDAPNNPELNDQKDVNKTDETVFDVNDLESPLEFRVNLKLLVQNYKTNEWVEGVVEEIDLDEEEILIKYENGQDCPEEWLSMSSQRIKKKIPIAKIEKVETAQSESDIKESDKQVPVATPALSDIGAAPTTTSSKELKVSSKVAPSSSRAKTLPRKLRPSSKKKISSNRIMVPIKKPFKKSLALSKKVKQHTKLQQVSGKVNRRLPIWKAHKLASSNVNALASKSCPIRVGKFSEGEKVLAKWSDHRMQKFPAVIKKVCGGGIYDVLFYDGFEKSIPEDNLFKTTEEEMAKYKECKPSEADSFVDMDIASKHERRQKKRKTFDDFFEEKDLKRKKKVDPYDLNHSESFLRASLSRNKPTIQSFSVHARKGSHTPKSMIVTSTPKTDATVSLQLTQAQVPEPLSTPKKAITPPSPPPVVPESKEPLAGPEVVEDVKSEDTDPPQSNTSLKHPLEITCHDGIVRKSILIDDDKLPLGWTKHVIAWVENVWACFLFTPDGYALHSMIELKKYCRMSDGQDPHDGVDFSFPKDSLLDLAEMQKNLIARADYRKWVNKNLDERKVTKKVRILPPSRSIGSGGHFSTKRVRTLLPRYRSHTFSQGGSVKAMEGKSWRCPKSECDKKFRKENLLQMHIKHYHVELSELAGKAPNVVDLALARSSADGVFTPDPTLVKRLTPKSPAYEQNNDVVSEPQPSKLDTIAPNKDEIVNNKISDESTNSAVSSSSPAQVIQSSLKVHTPIKLSSEYPDKEEAVPLTEKSRPMYTPKSNLKKYDYKLMDESYIAGSRSLKKKQQMLEKFHSTDFNDGSSEMGGEAKDEGVILERLQNEEIINCICGFREEDGLMVQCEVCLCWQHGACHGMEKDLDVPDRYVCAICLEPHHVRSSQRYSYANHYLTISKLPKFSHRTCKKDVLKHRESILSKSFELTFNLQNIHRMERALTAKINIAQQKDHPKLYLWSTNWDSPKKKSHPPNPKKTNMDGLDKGRRGPVGEEPIESIDCRLRLLDRIEADQQDIESRLTIIQAQLQALESEDFEQSGEDREGGGDPLLKQAVYMLLRDLSTIATATSLS